VSDTSRGPGWWDASDKKWYPPETHPFYRASEYAGHGAIPFSPGPSPYPRGTAYSIGPPSLANYGQRIAGWLLDWVILLVPSLALAALTHSIHTHHSSTGASFNVGMPGALISPILIVIYGTVMCGSRRGQTLGMMVAGTRAVRASTGEPIGYPAALGRATFEWLLAVLLFLPWVIDMLFPIWDPRNQTLHDKFSGTVVIQTR